MSKRVAELLSDVYARLSEGETSSNAVFPQSRVLGALNDAQGMIESALADVGQGYFREVDVEVAADADTIEPGLDRVLAVNGIWQLDAASDPYAEVALGRPPLGVAWLEGVEPAYVRLASAVSQAYTFRLSLLLHGAAMHTGTAASGGATSIVFPSSATLGEVSASDDYYIGAWVYIVSGTGSGQRRQVTDYDGDTREATVATWTTNPDDTSVYCVEAGVPERLEVELAAGAAEILLGEEDTADGGTRRAMWERVMQGRVHAWGMRRQVRRR